MTRDQKQTGAAEACFTSAPPQLHLWRTHRSEPTPLPHLKPGEGFQVGDKGGWRPTGSLLQLSDCDRGGGGLKRFQINFSAKCKASPATPLPWPRPPRLAGGPSPLKPETLSVCNNVSGGAERGRAPTGQQRPTSVGLLMGPFSWQHQHLSLSQVTWQEVREDTPVLTCLTSPVRPSTWTSEFQAFQIPDVVVRGSSWARDLIRSPGFILPIHLSNQSIDQSIRVHKMSELKFKGEFQLRN